MSICVSPATDWVSTPRRPELHETTVEDHTTGERCRSIVSLLSSLDFSFITPMLSKKRNSFKN